AIVNLFGRLRDEMGISIVYITHDLATAYYISDRVIVMQKGEVVETGDARTVLSAPQHPYSRRLRESILTVDGPSPSASSYKRTDLPERTPCEKRQSCLIGSSP